MRIMHRKSTTVKHAALKSKRHRSTQETVKAFLGRHNWTDDGMTWGYTHKGQLHLLTLCPRCAALAATGRPTAAMTTNLTAYVKAGAA